MIIEFSVQLQPEASVMDKYAVTEEVETYVKEQFKLREVKLVNISNIHNPAGPDFTFRTNIFREDIFELINYIASEPIFNNLNSISGPKMKLDLTRRFDPDFDLKDYFYEQYGDILDEYEIKII